MAQKATIFKAAISVADLDRHYYEDHAMTIARHPSETEERMMLRIIAFALNAHERLEFTKGLSSDEEPDLWQKSYSNEIEVWIELGLPSEKRFRQACNKSDQTIIYNYGGNVADAWWSKMSGQCSRFKNLKVYNVVQNEVQELLQFSNRTMSLQITIQEGDVMVTDGVNSTTITPIVLQ